MKINLINRKIRTLFISTNKTRKILQENIRKSNKLKTKTLTISQNVV